MAGELWAPVDRDTKLPPKPTVDALEATNVEPHIDSDTPHPAYDDMPSLAVFYRNRKQVRRS